MPSFAISPACCQTSVSFVSVYLGRPKKLRTKLRDYLQRTEDQKLILTGNKRLEADKKSPHSLSPRGLADLSQVVEVPRRVMILGGEGAGSSG